MKNSKLLFLLLLILAIIVPNSCTSDNNDEGNPQNTISVNGTLHKLVYSGYKESESGIALYFGNKAYKESPTKSIEIKINANKPTENDYYFNDKDNIIYSAVYKNIEDGSEINTGNLTKGSLSIIQIEKFYLIDYDLIIDGNIIKGHHTSSMFPIEE